MDKHIIDTLKGQTVKLSLRDDIYHYLTGQITGCDDLYIVLHAESGKDIVIPHSSISCIHTHV